MKITIENYGKKMSVETDHEDLGIDEYIDIFYSLLVSVTFDESTIINGFKEFIESKEL
jgi:phosphatidylglycerophosphatase A